MNYTSSDLIDKLINVERSALEIYIKIEEKYRDESQLIGIVVRAIAKQEEKHIEYYEKLRNDLDGRVKDNIDFHLYDKVANLMFEFKNQIQLPELDDVQDLVKFALEFEKNNIALLLDIQGRLLEKMDDVNNIIYKVISQIINEEQEHEKMFEQLIVAEK